MKLRLVDAEIALDFHDTPAELVLDRLETKALLCIVCDGLDVVLAKEIGECVEDQRFARARTTVEERNDLPRIFLVDFKEEASEEHVDDLNDSMFFVRRQLAHLIFNDLLQFRSRDVLPIFLIHQFGIKVGVVVVDGDDFRRHVRVAVRLESDVVRALEAVLKGKPVTVGLEVAKFGFAARLELGSRLLEVGPRGHVLPHFKRRFFGSGRLDEGFDVHFFSPCVGSIAPAVLENGAQNFLLALVAIPLLAFERQ